MSSTSKQIEELKLAIKFDIVAPAEEQNDCHQYLREWQRELTAYFQFSTRGCLRALGAPTWIRLATMDSIICCSIAWSGPPAETVLTHPTAVVSTHACVAQRSPNRGMAGRQVNPRLRVEPSRPSLHPCRGKYLRRENFASLWVSHFHTRRCQNGFKRA